MQSFPTESIICSKTDLTMPLTRVTLYSLTLCVSFLFCKGSFTDEVAQTFVQHYCIFIKEFHLYGI